MVSINGNKYLAGLIKAVFVIMLVTFIAHFVFFPFFGLYEDDYILTLPGMGFSWADFRHEMLDTWIHPLMGRPLNHFLRQIFCFFTVRNGHLEAGFLLNWALVSANASVLYGLIRRFFSHAPALVGALVFVLFPIDTSRQILMIQTDLLVPILMLLVCFHLYLSRRYWAAFLLIWFSQLDLESLFPAFLAAPLLLAALTGERSWKNLVKRLVIHGLIMAVLFAVLVVGRIALGDDRARDASSNALDSISRVIRLGTEGPFHSLVELIRRPLEGAIHCSWTLLPYAALAIAVTMWGLNRRRPAGVAPESESAGPQYPEGRLILFVLIGGLMVWSLGYVLWIPDDYFPPVVSIGRMSAEHAAAAVGAGLVSASLAVWILSLSFIPKRLLALAFSVYCGSLVSFGVQIQLTEYVPYWEETKQFWSGFLNQIRDVEDGDAVLVEMSSDNRVMPVTKGFGSFDEPSYFPMALPIFVDFPKTWKQVPRLYALWPGCVSEDLGDSIRLHTPIWAPSIWPTIQSGNFIYFRVTDGRLERITDWVSIDGKRLLPKSVPTEDLSPLKVSKIYLNLVSPRQSDLWPSLRTARAYPR